MFRRSGYRFAANNMRHARNLEPVPIPQEWDKLLEGEDMAQTTRSSHPILSCTDGIATGGYDALLLAGRVLIAAVFVFTAGTGSPNVGYLTSLGFPAPAFWSVFAQTCEWIISLSLILGVGTRYGALLGLLYVIIASVVAHRYWQFPPAQQGVQYIFLTKNFAIAGGLILAFAIGPGRLSIDRMLAQR
jgi:putative oxidoreductase